jgi:regulator of replication initiation timing
MAKKRIADLLHEEAEKLSASEAETVQVEVVDQLPGIENEATEQVDNSTEKGRAKRANQTKADLETTIAELTNTNAQLEATVAELEQKLEQAGQVEIEKITTLEQQIAELHAELDQQKALVDQLTQEQEQVNSIKAELEKVKKTALELANENQKLIKENKSITKKPEPQDSKITPKKTDKPENPQNKHTTTGFLYFAEQKKSDPGDFASNAWLLD